MKIPCFMPDNYASLAIADKVALVIAHCDTILKIKQQLYSNFFTQRIVIQDKIVKSIKKYLQAYLEGKSAELLKKVETNFNNFSQSFKDTRVKNIANSSLSNQDLELMLTLMTTSFMPNHAYYEYTLERINLPAGLNDFRYYLLGSLQKARRQWFTKLGLDPSSSNDEADTSGLQKGATAFLLAVNALWFYKKGATASTFFVSALSVYLNAIKGELIDDIYGSLLNLEPQNLLMRH